MKGSQMKLKTVLVVTLFLFCFAGDAMTDDKPIPTTVEFEGPWTFIRITGDNTKAKCGGKLTDCIVAISPSRIHKDATFNEDNNTFKPGVYFLGLTNPKPDGIGNGNKAAKFVPIPSTSSSRLQVLLATSDLNRYVVILPDAPLEGSLLENPDPNKTSFEEPRDTGSMQYSEEVRITDHFVLPPRGPEGKPTRYTKGVKIHYTVTDLKATLMGTKNDGTSFSAREGKAPVTITVAPLDSAYFGCDMHPRAAFEEMNDLLHPFPNFTPRNYVDFPKYEWGCRLLDLQQFNGAIPAPQDAILPSVDSRDSINLRAVNELIGNLTTLNGQLHPNHGKVNESTINTLLQDVQKYLENPPRDKEEGKKLINKFDQILKRLGDPNDKDKTPEEKKLIVGLRTLRELLGILGGPSGANCKAPMTGGTVQ
jgi:hypothetical protein